MRPYESVVECHVFSRSRHEAEQRAPPVLPVVNTSRLSQLAFACVLAYAALTGFRTLSDFDVWWQLASGRYWIETGHLARQDVFSYTAQGRPWLYPAGSGLLFYLLYRLGGYGLLSLLAPMAAAITALLLLRKGGLLRAWIVALAVPPIAWRTSVRAEMFTTVFTAVYLVLLWEHVSSAPQNRKAPLWLLPVVMLAWVNLHPGFIVGVALVMVFLARAPRTLGPWAALTMLATFLNPWGWSVYRALWEQGKALGYQQAFLGEWSRVPLSFESASAAFRLRDPEGSYWLLVALVLAAVAVGLLHRRFWEALLLAGATVVSFRYLRFQALYAVTAAVVAPELLAELQPRWQALEERRRRTGEVLATVLLALVVLVRAADLASNREYLAHGELATFGAGVSSWFPERAVRFIEQHKLPGEIYHDYNLGGYLCWRAWPGHRVFIDGRALPFGPDLFFLQQRLARLGPEHPEWQRALERWQIHTLLVSTARFGGYGALPLKSFCDSKSFQLVYLDETAAIFVTTGSADVPALDCRTARLGTPPPAAPAVERFQFFANAGKLYYALERDGEAEQALAEAGRIFDGDPSLHLDLGQLRLAHGRMEEGEREFRRAIELRPTSTAWFALGNLLAFEKRYPEAAECFRQSAALSYQPHESYLALGQNYLAAGQPLPAREAFAEALRSSPFKGPAEPLGRGFTLRALSSRASAALALKDGGAAFSDLEPALKLAPSDPRLRLLRVQALLLVGRLAEAREELGRARQLGAAGPALEQLEQQTGQGPR